MSQGHKDIQIYRIMQAIEKKIRVGARLCVQDAGIKLSEEVAIVHDPPLSISFGEIFFPELSTESRLNKDKFLNHPSPTAREMFPLVRCQWGNTRFFLFAQKGRVLMGHRFVCQWRPDFHPFQSQCI
jgi:hypothetical protein